MNLRIQSHEGTPSRFIAPGISSVYIPPSHFYNALLLKKVWPEGIGWNRLGEMLRVAQHDNRLTNSDF